MFNFLAKLVVAAATIHAAPKMMRMFKNLKKSNAASAELTEVAERISQPRTPGDSGQLVQDFVAFGTLTERFRHHSDEFRRDANRLIPGWTPFPHLTQLQIGQQ